MESGAKVFVPDADFAWLPATVLDEDGGDVRVRVDGVPEDEGMAEGGEERVIGESALADAGLEALPLQNDDAGAEGVQDMARLNYLHEAALLYNLRTRHANDLPYTFTGDIVLAVNPDQWLRHLYTEDEQIAYSKAARHERPPHVYATSAAAFRGMTGEDRAGGPIDQSVLVSGESGAGKTETVKILMGHLATVAGAGTSGGGGSTIRKIIESNPLLESFGNAKTVRNDNSSRFGKFTQLQFNSEGASSSLVGSHCRTYLLEKTRVIGQSEGERNYHIFYQLLAAPEETKAALGLGGRGRLDFHYFSEGSSDETSIEGVSDADRFLRTVDALGLIGVSEDETHQILTALSAVLHLGQIPIEGRADNEEEAAVPDAGADALQAAADLLRVDKEVGVPNYEPPPGEAGLAGLREALTFRVVTARGESYSVPLTPEASISGRDALAKDLYAKLFDHLVASINKSTSATDAAAGQRRGTISLLDIFGFESFAVNRFEQLCINYANEKLQQKFTQDVFKNVQAEYESEGIAWDFVDFVDNAGTLDLIESRMGVISVLNEECVRPKGNDEALVSKLTSLHKDHPSFSKPPRLRNSAFEIVHYAGKVTYTAAGFLDKNRDTVPEQLAGICRTSGLPLVKQLFTSPPVVAENPKTPPRRRGSMLMANSVGSKFKTQLADLMETIGSTEVQYVRCVKPNPQKRARVMAHIQVVEQLRCAGVVEAIRISRSAFPNRMPHADVVLRFGMLDKEAPDCAGLLASLVPATEPPSFQMGSTRAYFRSGVLESLEDRRTAALSVSALVLQRHARGFVQRRRVKHAHAAARLVQAAERRRWNQRRFQVARAGAIKVQSKLRQRVARRVVVARRRNVNATQVQASWRRAAGRKAFLRQRSAAIRVQASVRRVQQEKAYRAALAQAKEDAKLENQLRLLQQRLEEEKRKREEMEAQLAAGGPAAAAAAAPAAAAAGTAVPAPTATVSTEESDALMAESGRLLDTMRHEVSRLRSQNTQLKAEAEELRSELQQSRTHGDLNDARSAAASNQLADLRGANRRLAAVIDEKTVENQNLKRQVLSMRDQLVAHAKSAEMVGGAYTENRKLQTLIGQQREELAIKNSQYQAELALRLQHEQLWSKMVVMLEKEIGDQHPDIVADARTIFEQGVRGSDEDPMAIADRFMSPPRRQSSITARFLGWMSSPGTPGSGI